MPSMLEEIAATIKQQFVEGQTLLSFVEYLSIVKQHPYEQSRSTAQYLVDMLDYFGSQVVQLPHDKVARYRLFGLEWMQNGQHTNHQAQLAICGIEQVQESLYQCLQNFARAGRVNKLILLHGPNGSAKSTLCQRLMAGVEAFAYTPQGALYTFSWIFPNEKQSASDRIGFGGSSKTIQTQSYARLSLDQIDIRMPCDMRCHPLFLLPKSVRPTFLTATDFISDYVKYGDLCLKCRRIFDALLQSYQGDLLSVLKHIQVERMSMSRRYRQGLATVEPAMSVDGRMQQITVDRSLSQMPKALAHLSLFEQQGALVDANRGVLELNDLLKRPVDAFKYLLSAVETSSVMLDSFALFFDTLFIASCNETYLDAFSQHPDFPSFQARTEFIRVPYLRQISKEQQIYAQSITPQSIGRHVAPHVIKTAATFAVLTRLLPVDLSRYSENLKPLLEQLKPLEKAFLYDNEAAPSYLSLLQQKELRAVVKDIYQEWDHIQIYEGRQGMSAREVRALLLTAGSNQHFRCLHPLAVLTAIEQNFIPELAKPVTAEQEQSSLSNHNAYAPEALLAATTEYWLDLVEEEVRGAMRLADESQYSQLFMRYILHISHWVKNERFFDEKLNQNVDPDENFMQDIEQVLLEQGQTATDFRRAIIGTIGARALEQSPQVEIDYKTMFHGYITCLRADFFAKRRKLLRQRMEIYLKYSSAERELLDPKDQQLGLIMHQVLTQDLNYCAACAQDTVATLMKRRYSDA